MRYHATRVYIRCQPGTRSQSQPNALKNHDKKERKELIRMKEEKVICSCGNALLRGRERLRNRRCCAVGALRADSARVPCASSVLHSSFPAF